MTININTTWELDCHFVSTMDGKEAHFDATSISRDHYHAETLGRSF